MISIILFAAIYATASCPEEANLSLLHDWATQSYMIPVPYRGNAETDWMLTVVSFLELNYFLVSSSKCQLSSQQISDNIYDFYNDNNYDDNVFRECKKIMLDDTTSGMHGYAAYCALHYISYKGIVTKLTRGKNDKIVPIGIRNVTLSEFEETKGRYDGAMLLFKLLFLLTKGSVIANIDLSNIVGYNYDIIRDYHATDYVLLVGMYKDQNEHVFLKFQSTFGQYWGCGGYGYVRISDNYNIVNNRGILSMLTHAHIFEKSQPEPSNFKTFALIVFNAFYTFYAFYAFYIFVSLCAVVVVFVFNHLRY